MVNVIYQGRTCNNLFQYVFARILAEKNGLQMKKPWEHPEFISITEPVAGRTILNPTAYIDDQVKIEDWYNMDYTQSHVVIKGFFQYPELYIPYKNKILSWMFLPEMAAGHEDDIVCHLRLDDYILLNEVISPEWYAGILNRPENAGKRVTVVFQQPKRNWEMEYINKLKALCSRELLFYFGNDIVRDFHFIRSFGTILCSNSSYCWWATFLSRAKKVYSFSRWMVGTTATLQATPGFEAVDGEYFNVGKK